MKPFHRILPDIMSCADRRVECSSLQQLSTSELHDLIYHLCRTGIEAIAPLAQDSHEDMVLAREQTTAATQRFLERLLVSLRPVFFSISGQIPTSTSQRKGEAFRREYDQNLVGYEFIDGRKANRVPNRGHRFTGTSYWIVGLRPEGIMHGVECGLRFAEVHHSGMTDHNGIERTSTVSLISAQQAAASIKYSALAQGMITLRERLIAVAQHSKSDQTGRLWDFCEKIDQAASALGAV